MKTLVNSKTEAIKLFNTWKQIFNPPNVEDISSFPCLIVWEQPPIYTPDEVTLYCYWYEFIYPDDLCI